MALTDGIQCAYRMDELPGLDREDLTGNGNALASCFPGAPGTEDLWVMGDGGGSHYTEGRFCRLGFWHRLLTSGEKTTLYNSGSGQVWSGISGGSLNDARAYYNLDGSSLADATGRNTDMTASSSPGSAAGPGGSGTAYTFNGTSQQLNHPHSDDFVWQALQPDGTGGKLTLSYWVYLTTIDNGSHISAILTKAASGGFPVEIYEYYRHDSGDRRFHTDQGSAPSDPELMVLKADTFGAPSAATWYHVLHEIDLEQNLNRITVNNASSDEWLDSVVPTSPDILATGCQFLDSYAFTGLTQGRSAGKYLTAPAGAAGDLTGGDYDWSVFVWLAITNRSPGHNQHVMGKFQVSGSVIEWSLDFYAPSTLYFQLGNGNGSSFAFPDVSVSDSGLHSVYLEYKNVSGTRTCKIRIDDATENEDSVGFTPAEVTSIDFRMGFSNTLVGGASGGGINIADMQFVGEVGPWAKWSRTLTPSEITELHTLGPDEFYPWGGGGSVTGPLTGGRLVDGMLTKGGRLVA